MSSRIAITMRVVDADAYRDPRDAISQDWIRLLQDEGLDPVLVPNVLSDPIAFVRNAGVKALILSNGEDVHPVTRGAEVTAACGDLARDQTESKLLSWCLENDVPVLAVCRGFQLVNVLQGGALVGDINQEIPGNVGHVATVHNVDIVAPIVPGLVVPACELVNSFHNQGITMKTLADSLHAFALSGDGVVEGFYMKEKPLLGIQWHPERDGPDTFCQRSLPVQFLLEGAWWCQGKQARAT
jgi:gamma-glutamyl-gamma-aminobutyrate hydrolase PuuD